ncbi:hypothetical protein PPL_02144 [Heterostelium album PN500]|uniref:Uncharacterized protein n=1 Tax=Heterostelium pallidum (strain ATCC 26659 / Pp 5 / PN500) TaxID=670386 RepID=D3B1H1_HETP5|nr:hypothetical protein PPL_02144 [Heterostelium album PN500]EFA85145.1 hypothetical protein PPL_02144 [Heterostelium album PN500]|eukprot:XP_020437254.1 hypothetical protein PPL_02144 [Heterostelium album PN500]
MVTTLINLFGDDDDVDCSGGWFKVELEVEVTVNSSVIRLFVKWVFATNNNIKKVQDFIPK